MARRPDTSIPADGSIDFDAVADSVDELLAVCGCATLTCLEELLSDYVDGYVYILGSGQAVDTGSCGEGDLEIYVEVAARSTCHGFPLRVGDVFECADDITQVWYFDSGIDDLTSAIEDLEGFTVELELDHRAAVPAWLQRRMSNEGRLVQTVIPYPYKLRMKGSATLDEWLHGRLLRHNPGLRITGYPRERDRRVTLAELRNPSPVRRPRPR